MVRLRVDPDSPDPAIFEKAAQVIRAGGIIALPTDTLYGLAADPFRPEPVARVFLAKGRPADHALTLIAADLAQVRSCIGALPPIADELARTFWPGPLTLLLAAPATLAAEVTGGTGRVGVRVPAHEVARALCRACAIPLTATSANVSREPATNDPDRVERTLRDRIDLLLDGGQTSGGPPSTIVDVTGPRPRLVRVGAVPWDEVLLCVDHP